ncbi:MAG: LysR family transcriptional regulator [Lachnospiraceae bacterium]|nr:LysR family transcriptional regulator [Lachnospiraceae bacterium]
MTTNQMQEFVVLAEELNFSRAAKKLYITQSVLSRHISELEEEIGFKLFLRSTRSVSLTEAGKQMALDSVRLLNKWNKMENRIKMEGLGAVGSLRIAGTRSTMGRVFLDFLRQFSNRYHGISIEVKVLEGDFGVDEMLRQDVLFSACQYSNCPEGIQQTALFRQPAYVACQKGIQIGHGPFVELSDLENRSLIVPHDDELWGPYSQHRILAEKCTNGRISVLQAYNVTSALLMASQGYGVTIVPRACVSVEHPLNLYEVTTKECNFNIYMYYNKTQQNPAARLFYENAIAQQNIVSTEPV